MGYCYWIGRLRTLIIKLHKREDFSILLYTRTVLLLVGAGRAENCTDVDTSACALLHAKQPSLCENPTLFGICKRYCGQCPLQCNSCPQLVQDPRDCNETVTCSEGEVCYMMEVTDFHHRHGFRGGCVSKDSCVPNSQFILIGRRSDSNMKMNCCTEDNCNRQILKTDITATTMTTTTHCADNSQSPCDPKLCGHGFYQVLCLHTCGRCWDT